jgi:hypothetical protein
VALVSSWRARSVGNDRVLLLIETDMIRQGLDADPHVLALLSAMPKFILKRIQPGGCQLAAPHIVTGDISCPSGCVAARVRGDLPAAKSVLDRSRPPVMRAADHSMSRRSTIADRRCGPGWRTSPAVRRDGLPLAARSATVAMTTCNRRSIPGHPNICVDSDWGTNTGTSREFLACAEATGEKIEPEGAQQHSDQ